MEPKSKHNHISNKVLKINVPKSLENKLNPSKNTMSVIITKDDTYFVDGQELDYDSLTALVMDEMDHDSLFTTLRIEGHKDARYEAVFKLMTFADKQALRVALAYKK